MNAIRKTILSLLGNVPEGPQKGTEPRIGSSKMKLPEPHFQGRLDVFCALYAVINALVLTHDLPPLRGRQILHEGILEMAQDRERFKLQLDQSMEFHAVVDSALNREVLRQDLLISTPFNMEVEAPKEEVWSRISQWLRQPKRAVILRFVRPLDKPGRPEIRHWSTAYTVEDKAIQLFDCSLEATAIQEIPKDACITTPIGLKPGLIYLDPASIRLLAAG